MIELFLAQLTTLCLKKPDPYYVLK